MMATPNSDAPGVCSACGSVSGRWGGVRVGDQPVRVNNALLVARVCTGCDDVELRARNGGTALVPPAPRGHGRELFAGVLRNVVDAVQALARALRDRYRRKRE
jgi:hypothetical protein